MFMLIWNTIQRLLDNICDIRIVQGYRTVFICVKYSDRCSGFNYGDHFSQSSFFGLLLSPQRNCGNFHNEAQDFTKHATAPGRNNTFTADFIQ